MMLLLDSEIVGREESILSNPQTPHDLTSPSRECSYCNGTGWYANRPCPYCGGSGRVL